MNTTTEETTGSHLIRIKRRSDEKPFRMLHLYAREVREDGIVYAGYTGLARSESEAKRLAKLIRDRHAADGVDIGVTIIPIEVN